MAITLTDEEYADLVADRGRLEWMARRRAGIEFNLFEGTYDVHYRYRFRSNGGLTRDFKDYRAAIDSAMEMTETLVKKDGCDE